MGSPNNDTPLQGGSLSMLLRMMLKLKSSSSLKIIQLHMVHNYQDVFKGIEIKKLYRFPLLLQSRTCINSIPPTVMRTIPVSYSLFLELWTELIHWVVIANSQSDLCWRCQDNTNRILKNANTTNGEKQQLHHLLLAEKESEYHNFQRGLATEHFNSHPNPDIFSLTVPCSFDGVAH